jgi:hypothetical protein
MEKLVRDAQELFHINVTGRQVMSLITYEKELLAWNKKFNLTAIRDVESIRTKHFLDSFSCVLAWTSTPPPRIIDVGTGAGFPGIPLKILYPNMELTLVESVGKKAKFCQHIVDLRLGRDVGRDPGHGRGCSLRSARRRAALVGRGHQSVRGASTDRDRGAVLDEGLRAREPDAAAAAGDQHRIAVECAPGCLTFRDRFEESVCSRT